MTYGVTSTGFVTKTYADIIDEIEEAEKSTIDPALDVSADGPLGQFNGIISAKIAEIWEVAEAIYRGMDPDQNSGDAQDAIAAITGVVRLGEDYSTVTITCTGTPATVLLVGRKVSTGAGDYFSSTLEKTIAAAAAWAGTTAYVLDDIVTNDSNIYVCVQAGTSAAAGGPTGTNDDITDGTCKWDFCGDGTGYVDVSFTADEAGAIAAYAGAIDTEDSVGSIETPVSGWEDARNLNDAIQGRSIETDAALRLRRETLLRATGNASLEALIADVLDVADVTTVAGFENTTDVTDGDGLPPHSFEIVALGGTDQAIADQIWESKAAGIETYGSTSKTVIDSLGYNHTIKFSRPTVKDVYVELTIDYYADEYPADGDSQIKAAIAAWGSSLGVGIDVIYTQLYPVILGIAGVVDITDLKISFSDPPAGTSNLTIGGREISAWDTSDIDVTSNVKTPT